jgi:ferritin
MSLVETLELLSKAREYVAQGQEELIEQREIVDQLERCGRDPLEAILFLEDLEDMQDVYAAHMDRLERQVMSLVRPD